MMKETNAQTIGAYYWPFPNFGDMLNVTLLKDYFGLNIEQEDYTSADIAAIGSVLDKLTIGGKLGKRDKANQKNALADKPIHIWGTGYMHQYPCDVQKPLRPMIVHAVRGEKTRQQLSAILKKSLSCPLGDPGILASKVVPAAEKQWDVGLVPHYVDLENPVFEQMLAYYPKALLIDVREDPETVLKQISSCRTIFSTSLHGIIAADSYGVPSCWCECSDKILGNGFKYHDYYSAFGTDRKVCDLLSGKLPDPDKECRTSFRSYKDVARMQKDLIKCFPYAGKNTESGLFHTIFSRFR